MSNQLDYPIKLTMTAKLKSGIIVDRYTEESPLIFMPGKQEVLPAIENTALEMNVGDSEIVEVSYENAFGGYEIEKIKSINRDKLPKNTPLYPDLMIEIQDTTTNEKVPGIIKAINENKFIVDFNHPLAGKDLIIEIKRVE